MIETNDYKECKTSELPFGMLTQRDEDLLYAYYKSQKFLKIVSVVFMILMFYIAVAGWFSNDAELKVKMILTGIGGVFFVLIYVYAYPKPIKAEGVIYGRIEAAHYESHRSGNKQRVYIYYYANIAFDSVMRRSIRVEIPGFEEKQSNGETLTKSPEANTEVAIFKIKEKRFLMIYPSMFVGIEK